MAEKRPVKADDGSRRVARMLEQAKADIIVNASKLLDPKRFMNLALTVHKRNPGLLRCTDESVIKALRESAEMGLEPDTAKQEAHLIPYGIECVLVPGYRGLLKLARSAGVVLAYAEIVREHDEFSWQRGTAPLIHHRPKRDDRGKLTHAYAVFKTADGEQDFEVLDHAEIEKVRQSSRAGQKGPWVTHYPEMARKTALRKLLKRGPMSAELAKALEVDARDYQHAEEANYRELPSVLGIPAPATDEEMAAQDQKVAPLPPRTRKNRQMPPKTADVGQEWPQTGQEVHRVEEPKKHDVSKPQEVMTNPSPGPTEAPQAPSGRGEDLLAALEAVTTMDELDRFEKLWTLAVKRTLPDDYVRRINKLGYEKRQEIEGSSRR